MDSKELTEKVRAHLIDKHGAVKDEWEGLLQLLDYHYDLLQTARNEIYTNGMVVNGRGGVQPSPFIKIFHDSSTQCQKILSEFGCSPKAAGKVKKEETENDADFINALLS